MMFVVFLMIIIVHPLNLLLYIDIALIELR